VRQHVAGGRVTNHGSAAAHERRLAAGLCPLGGRTASCPCESCGTVVSSEMHELNSWHGRFVTEDRHSIASIAEVDLLRQTAPLTKSGTSPGVGVKVRILARPSVRCAGWTRVAPRARCAASETATRVGASSARGATCGGLCTVLYFYTQTFDTLLLPEVTGWVTARTDGRLLRLI